MKTKYQFENKAELFTSLPSADQAEEFGLGVVVQIAEQMIELMPRIIKLFNKKNKIPAYIIKNDVTYSLTTKFIIDDDGKTAGHFKCGYCNDLGGWDVNTTAATEKAAKRNFKKQLIAKNYMV